MPTAGKGCPPDPLTGEIVPLIVVIDDGPGYKSAEFMAFIASGPELRHARTRHYAPEANRVVQRFNRTLKCEHLNRREITDGITQGQHLVDRVRHLQPGSQLRSNGDATVCVCVSDQGHSLLRVGQVFVRPLESPRRWSALASWRGRAGIGGLGVTDRMTVEGHQKGMVDQLRERGAVRSDPVARGFGAIPRHRFLPSMPLDRVYGFDEAIPTHFDGAGVPISSSSAPIIMAVMLEMLAIEPGQRVLEVGAGTGYNAALLGHLVGEEGSVTSIDIDPDVTAQAAANLDEAGITGVRIVTGDGWLGELGDHFDREMVTAECWDLSPHWVGQLAEGGILVLPLWLRPGLTLAVAFEKRDGVLASRSLAGCGFMPLRGPHGGSRRRTLVPAPPWDTGCDAAEGHWIAVFDEATDRRRELLEELLGRVGSARAAPPSFAGWSARLALDMTDSICFFPAVPGVPRSAAGLFDPNFPSLAVVVGETLHGFGDPSCCERLTAFLSEPRPLDFTDLRITATRRGSAWDPASPSLRLTREHFDFDVTEVSTSGDGRS